MSRHPTKNVSRKNWQDVMEFVDFCREVRQVGERSAEVYYYSLRYLLDWAIDIPLHKVEKLRPTFPVFLEEQPISHGYRKRTCSRARRFLTWLKIEYPQRFVPIRRHWIEPLRPKSRSDGEIRDQELYTVEEVMKLIALPAKTLIQQRDRAAVAMLFLSGMRNGAFCTIPVRAVHVHEGTGKLRQWPKLGVKMKWKSIHFVC